MTDEHWDRLATNREKPAEVKSIENAANEFWNKEAIPVAALPVPEPEPPPPPSRPAVFPAPPIVRSNFGMRRW